MTPTGQTPAGWYADPAGRYVHRWYDGRDWTAHVAGADGSTGTDPAWSSAATTPAHGHAAGVGSTPIGGSVSNVVGPSLITAIVGAALLLVGAAALPWVSFSGFGGSLDLSLADLITTEDTGLFITSRIFWGGAVIGLLLLAAASAIAAPFKPALRIPAFLIGLIALAWQCSATLMTIGRDWDDSLHVEFTWFDGWGIGLWVTTIGLVVVTVASLLPPAGDHR